MSVPLDGGIQSSGELSPSWGGNLPPGFGCLDAYTFSELELEFDAKFKALWFYQAHQQRPNFTNALIDDIKAAQSLVHDVFREAGDADRNPVRYMIWASRRTNIFNLGGDLIYFADLLEKRDRQGMAEYAEACIDICFQNYRNLDLPVTTVALASGDALGGGLESALSSDVLVVEKSAQFGFPEILFGLFPGMGAYSFVHRRVGAKIADEMIFSGRIYRGEQLYEMGLADVLAPDGEGEATLHDYLAKHDRKFAARQALHDVRRTVHGIDKAEMDRIGERWVETAMSLDERDIKKMRRLANAQRERLEGKRVHRSAQASNGVKVETAKGLELEGKSTAVSRERENVAAYPVARAAAPAQKDDQTTAKILNLSGVPIWAKTDPGAEHSNQLKGTMMAAKSTSPTDDETPAMTGAGAARRTPGAGLSTADVYGQILEDVAEARASATLQPGVERLLSEGMDREEYLDFLEQLYHVVWHFCPTMAAAAARCGDDLRELRYALYHNIEEEKGHETWVLDDIVGVGGDPEAVAASRPAVPVQAMIGYNYYVADRENPWAVLGMVHVLEEISANYSGRVASAVAKRLGINDGKGFRFLGSHGLMDVSHVNSFKNLVGNVRSRDDIDAIVEAAKVNYALFGALFREA